MRKSPTSPYPATPRGISIELYGWDSQSATWHGPNELDSRGIPDRRLLDALCSTPGTSWYGPVNCRIPGGPSTRLFTLVHDLADCAIASIYCDESKSGPAEILCVIPATRRGHLREDFAFEFLAFARFLGALEAGAEIEVHNAIDAALRESDPASTLVLCFSSDLDPVISVCAEKLAVTLCHWLAHMPQSASAA